MKVFFIFIFGLAKKIFQPLLLLLAGGVFLFGWFRFWENHYRFHPRIIKEIQSVPYYSDVSESHSGTTGSASVDSFSWTHNPVETPKGVLVFVNSVATSDLATSVTYGGVSLNRVVGGTAVDNAGEPGAVSAWFLGSGIPTGSQTVTVNRVNNASQVYATCITLPANTDTEIVGTPVLLQGDGIYSAQAVNTGNRTTQRIAAGYSGTSSVLPVDAKSLSTGASGQIDYGVYTFTTAYEFANGFGSRYVGFTVASDDRAAVHLAVGDFDTETVNFDAVSESHNLTVGSTSVSSFSWTHTPLQTPKGVLVFVNSVATSDLATSVTYGGVSLNRVVGGTAVDNAGEPGAVSAWFLGSGIPTGSQTVVVNRVNNTSQVYAVCITVTTLNNNTQVVGTPVLLQGDGAYTIQAVDSSTLPARRFAAAFCGADSLISAGIGSQSTGASGQIDYGAYTFITAFEKGRGSGSRSVGFNYATSDDRAAVHLAIGEITPVYSVSITPEGTIEYGQVERGQSKSTLQVGQTKLAINDGNVTANFNIKTSEAVGGTAWTIGANPGTNVFVHEFSTNGGGSWTKFDDSVNYKTLATSVGVGASTPFDLRITVPTETDLEQKTITVTVQAVSP